ncbi:excalibur calcium-binding domain-containing protein [Streptomyces sp. NPDC102451]|uniref:excalibur calcium-binding domain-containing protein n=1 Tax=Streptomyces sp. NPDC102451 TaxID=3366177 RepID=UPI0037FC6B28
MTLGDGRRAPGHVRARRVHPHCGEPHAVRAAGAAPIHRGDPGYGSHLDRDGDGVACE